MSRKFLAAALAAVFGLLTACGGTGSSARPVLPFVTDAFPLPPSERSTLAEPRTNYIFDIDAVPEITIYVAVSNWNQILSNFDANHANEITVPAAFVFNKNGRVEALRNIGFRLRGNVFSRKRPEGFFDRGTGQGTPHDPDNPSWHHAHFRVVFDTYDRDQRFHGERSLNLKWFNNDPDYCRDVYCYDLFHRFGMPLAARSTYCRVSIRVGDEKPAYFGVYEMVETVDREFVKSRFPGNYDGHLWKCLYPASLLGNFPHNKIGMEDPDNGYNPIYDYKSKKSEFEAAKTQLLDFITKLNGLEGAEFEKWIAKSFDVDMFLRAYSVNVMVGMWDDYWNNQNNYYLYFDNKGKAYFIAYDYDNTLGTAQGTDTGSVDIYRFGKTDGSRPLIEKILGIPKYRATYAYYIAQLISETNRLFDAGASLTRITNWQNLIRPYVANDTGEDMKIYDAPARWGRMGFYRLLSGTWDITNDESNYFLRRTRFAQEQLGLPVTGESNR